MALVKCRECGKQVSTVDKFCPHCGLPDPSGGSTPTAGRCHGCGKDISVTAYDPCPNCGVEIPLVRLRPPSGREQRNPHGDQGGSGFGIAALVLGIGGVVMPYFAAAFLVPAAFVCGLIAVRRGQKGMGVAGMALAVLGMISIIYVSSEIGRVFRDPFAPNPLTISEPPVVTLAEYEQIKEGMTYAQVTSLIGAPGQEMSRSDLAGYTTVMYSWSNHNGSNMNAMFQNGGLVNKAQFGLR